MLGLSVRSRDVDTGSSYIRWGRRTCRNTSSLVYAGNVREQNTLLQMYGLLVQKVLIKYCCQTFSQDQDQHFFSKPRTMQHFSYSIECFNLTCYYIMHTCI